MNEAEKDEHYIKLCVHLRAGGELTPFGGINFSLVDATLSSIAKYPESYEIVERPMVYVYGVVNNPEKQYAITTHELRGVPIDEQLFGMAKAYTLICSFPIEEQNNA